MEWSFIVIFLGIAGGSLCYDCSRGGRRLVTVTPVTAPVEHGEGPHWDAETGALFFVDIASELVNRYDPKTNQVTHAKLEGGGVSLVVPVANSGARRILASRGHDLVVFEWDYTNTTIASNDNKAATVLASVEQDPTKTGNRWNDGKADPRGRLWAGTMGPEPTVGNVTPNQGSFYRVDASTDFNPITEVTPVSISNGLAWNKYNTRLYYIDTATDQVDVFDYDIEAGNISNRRKVFSFTEKGVAGHPDGMTIDSRGNLWIACFSGGQVINVDPNSGDLVQTVKIPASRVTSAMFGGPNLDILYVTTSRLGLSPEEQQKQPLAGSVFAIQNLGLTALAPANDVVVPQNKFH